MDFITFLLLLSSIPFILYFFTRRSSKFPPGPFPIPIIGNILQLGPNPHRSLTKLSKTYGPLMHLKLGTLDTIVVSSPEMAKEILQKHDAACSGRMPFPAADHDKFSILFQPVGDQWRRLRKICKEEMFTKQKMEASEALRQEKLEQLHDYLDQCCSRGGLVNIEEVAFVTTLNLMTSTLFSVDFAGFESDSGEEMRELVKTVMKLAGTPNFDNYFPILKAFDPQGIKRDLEINLGKLIEKFDEIIAKRLQSRVLSSESSGKRDLLEALLDINEENGSYLSRNDMNHLLLDLIVGGSDTTSDTVHWAMTELLRHPEKMSKAKDELRTVVGRNKQVKESDISKLFYLNAVIKETFRLHPPGPFLVPHRTETNVEINGYLVPKGAQIFINVWAIGRDSSIWQNPDSFEPERFINDKVDYRGRDFELIPFSSGRRMCPGMPLAHLMLHLMVATLVHNFDWKIELGLKPEELDLNEVFGLSIRKAVPLEAFPIKK